jgi:hypothetical protein
MFFTLDISFISDFRLKEKHQVFLGLEPTGLGMGATPSEI